MVAPHTLDTTLASAKRADKNLNTETHPHEAIAGDSQDVIDAAEQREGPVCQSSCSIYKTEDGTAIPVSQAEHYACRSLDLIAMSFDEFVMTMQIVKVLHRQVMATTILNKLCSQEDLTIMSTSFCAHILSQPFTSSERTQSLTSPYCFETRRHNCQLLHQGEGQARGRRHKTPRRGCVQHTSLQYSSLGMDTPSSASTNHRKHGASTFGVCRMRHQAVNQTKSRMHLLELHKEDCSELRM